MKYTHGYINNAIFFDVVLLLLLIISYVIYNLLGKPEGWNGAEKDSHNVQTQYVEHQHDNGAVVVVIWSTQPIR